MDVKLSQTTSNIKKREAEQQDVGLAKVNKHQPSYKRKKNMNKGIKIDKEPLIEQFGDVDFNYESAPQKNDLGGGSAEEALGAQPAEGEVMNEDNVEAPPMSEEPQNEVSQKETAALIDDTCPPDKSLLLSFKFHRARSIYLSQEPGRLRVHHHAPTLHLQKKPTIVRDLIMLAGSWSLPKLVEIFKNNLYQDEDFFNSMKTKGQDNSLSLVKLVNFYARKLEKYNDSIHNERPAGQKKKAMSALSVARTYMLWKWGLSITDQTGARELLKYREAFDNYKVEDATECEKLGVRIEQMKEDKILNDVVHEQYVKSFEKLPAKLEEKTKEYQVLNVQNTKLVEDLRIKTRVDASNASLAIELAKQRRKCKLLQDINTKLAEQSERQHSESVPLAVIPKGEVVPSRDLQKKIDELIVNYEDIVKRLKEKKSCYHLDVRGVQGEDGNSAFRVPATIKHQSQNQFKKVMNLLESLLSKDLAFWKTVFSQSLDTYFSSRGEMVYKQLRRACSYGGQHVEYRHMGHLLATCL
ncbi:hypothetical protein GIB67_034747 [Kingdonia uniflora]|uniref:Uncharacterized protein n=1 Tax=Kingdonia uniflora TaxID=39325 RepID=A0A7J7MLE9_9MAGN|nr:hypothetical protein GIB67_034747 [Kingdonia uniflora]